MAYPDDIFDPRDLENMPNVVYDEDKKTVLFAEDVIFLDDEVVAIEETLGLNPEGEFDTVVKRLDQLAPAGASIFNVHYSNYRSALGNVILDTRLLVEEEITVFDNQPDMPRGLRFRVFILAPGGNVDIDIEGIDANNNVIIDSLHFEFPFGGTEAQYTPHCFVELIKVTVYNFTGVEGSLAIGQNRRIGFPNYPLTLESDVFKVMLDGRDFTAYTVDPELGWIEFAAESIEAGQSIGIIYRPS